jgi:hypothetical protein
MLGPPEPPRLDPDLLGIRPTPVLTRVLYLPIGGPTSTAVLRVWGPGDAGRCTLCCRCSVDDGVCLVGIDRIVPRAEAEALTDRDCDWAGPRGGPHDGGLTRGERGR